MSYHALDDEAITAVEAANHRVDGTVQELLVKVPPGALPGQTLQGRTPEGVSFAFKLPIDFTGSKIKIRVPRNGQSRDTMKVRVPEGTREGAEIMGVTPAGVKFTCKVPAGVAPGELFVVQVPQQSTRESAPAAAAAVAPNEQVTIRLPEVCQPGQKMKVKIADGRSVTFDVPSNATPGGVIHLNVPRSGQESSNGVSPGNAAASLRAAAPAMIETEDSLNLHVIASVASLDRRRQSLPHDGDQVLIGTLI